VGACCMQISRDANDRLDHLREKPDCQSSSPNSDVEDDAASPFVATTDL
jgi:hypothetical protein